MHKDRSINVVEVTRQESLPDLKYLKENTAAAEEIELKLRELLLSHNPPTEIAVAPVVEEFTPSDDELDSLSLSDDI